MKNEKYIIDAKSNILQAISLIKYNKNRMIFISRNNKIIGSLSNGDILNGLLNRTDMNANVTKVMNKSFIYLKDKDLKLAKSLFKKTGVSIIPVLNSKMIIDHLYFLNDFL